MTPADVAFTYRVERSTDGGRTWVELVVTDKTTYTDSPLDAGTSYTYRVTPLNGTIAGESVTVIVATKEVEKQSITPEPVVPAPAVRPKLSVSLDMTASRVTDGSAARIFGSFVKPRSKVSVSLEALTGDLVGAGSKNVLSIRANKFGKFGATVDFASDLPAGRYLLAMRAVDADGKAVVKTVRFTIKAKQSSGNDSGEERPSDGTSDGGSNEGDPTDGPGQGSEAESDGTDSGGDGGSEVTPTTTSPNESTTSTTPTNDVDRADPQDGIRNWGFWRIALAVSIALFWLWLIRVARRWWVRRRLLLAADDDDDEEEKEAN